VDNKPAFPELFKFSGQGGGSVQRIIIKDILPPAIQQTGCFLRAGMITGGDKEKIIIKFLPSASFMAFFSGLISSTSFLMGSYFIHVYGF